MRSSTSPCTGIGTTRKSHAGQRCLAVRRRSARAELGALVRMAMQPGRCGSGRLRAGSSKPSLSSCRFTCSKRRSTVERLGRISRACTLKLARAPQKFSLPTTRTPSPSVGRKLSRATVEAQATAWIEASPSLRLNQRWPFFKTGLTTAPSTKKRGANPRSSNTPMASLSLLTL